MYSHGQTNLRNLLLFNMTGSITYERYSKVLSTSTYDILTSMNWEVHLFTSFSSSSQQTKENYLTLAGSNCNYVRRLAEDY